MIFTKFKGFSCGVLTEQALLRKSKPPENCHKSGLFWASPFTMHLVCTPALKQNKKIKPALKPQNQHLKKEKKDQNRNLRPIPALIGDGPNTVSGSTGSNTELSEFFGAHWVPGSELSEFLLAYYLCVKANSPSFSQNSPSLPQNSVRLSEFSSPKQYSRNSIGFGQQLFNFRSPAVHWMARTSSLNCLSCRNPYQTPFIHWIPPPFSLKSVTGRIYSPSWAQRGR